MTDLESTDILIIEDSRADRARFRRLLGGTNVAFEFAWSWDESSTPGVMPWFRRHLASTNSRTETEAAGAYLLRLLEAGDASHLLSQYAVIVVDLAWSNSSEAMMREEQGMTIHRGRELARGDSELRLQQLIASVEGIALLEWRLRQNVDLPMWVTSAYVPAGAEGLREFLLLRYGVMPESALFHKWMDEEPLRADLIRFSEQRGVA